MKKIKKRFRITPLIVALLVLLAGMISYAYFAKVGPFEDHAADPPSGPTKQQKAEEEKTAASDKQTFIESTRNVEVPGTEVPVPSSSDSIKISASKETGIVTVKTELQGYASGSCKLEITNGTKSLTKSADIIYQPQFSTCAGFSIVIDELGPGTWELKLIVTPAGAAPIEKTAEVNV